MVATLPKLDQIAAKLNVKQAKSVLIAGVKHVKTDRENENDPNYDLSPLYQE